MPVLPPATPLPLLHLPLVGHEVPFPVRIASDTVFDPGQIAWQALASGRTEPALAFPSDSGASGLGSQVVQTVNSVSSTELQGQSLTQIGLGGDGGGEVVVGGSLRPDRLAAVGAATVPGTPGDDILAAGPGDSTLEGGQGNDLLSGGPGADDFLYRIGDGNDTVTGFDSANDRLIIFGASSVQVRSEGGTTVVELQDGSSITLQNAASALSTDVLLLG